MTKQEFIKLMEKNGMKFDDTVQEEPKAEGFRLYHENVSLSNLWGYVSDANIDNFSEVLDAWCLARDDDRKNILGLPYTAPDALIESMCYRYDHAHGIKQYKVDGFKWREETDDEFAARQHFNRNLMHKLYQEVAGYGFYKPEDNNEG